MRRIPPHLSRASHGKYAKSKNKKFVTQKRCKLKLKNNVLKSYKYFFSLKNIYYET